MANQVHTHGDAPPHEHADATPGHTHDAQGNVVAATGTGFETAPPPSAPTAATAPPVTPAAATPPYAHEAGTRPSVEIGPSGTGMAARVIFTLLGAAGLIVGAFLAWFSFGAQEVPPGVGLTGVEVSNSVFYSTDDPFGASFVSSAGLVAIALGVLALLGLVFRTGWLTTLAGVLGIVAFALVLITLFRVPDASFGIGNVGLGLWLVLAGGVLAVIGGFFGARPRIVSRGY
jgi:hypothetical protein